MWRIAYLSAMLSAGYVPSLAVAAVLWDNGSFDGRDAFSAYDFGSDWSITVDDVILSAPSHIDSMTGQFMIVGGYIDWAEVSVWQLPVHGAKPGSRIALRYELPVTYEQIGEIQGYPIYSITAHDVNIDLPAGDYYLGMQIGGTYSAYLCTAGNGKVKGYGGGWWWGVPYDDWWSARDILGYDTDFAFRLEGTPEPASLALLLVGAPVVLRGPLRALRA